MAEGQLSDRSIAVFGRSFDVWLENVQRAKVHPGYLLAVKRFDDADERAVEAHAATVRHLEAPTLRLFEDTRVKLGANATLEAVVLRYRELFPARTIETAERRLASIA